VEGEGQEVYYFHTDQIGTPLELTDNKGETVWQATYRSWGETERIYIDKVEQNIRFQGQYLDSETGLNYNLFRYFDPRAGRFITQDPIGLEGDYNLYAYAPNPLIWIDPFGWCKSAISGEKGRTKAIQDLERNGYEVVAEELTMKVNGSRVRADFVARDSQGRLHVFEVKHGAGALTKNQKAAGVYDINRPANTTQHLGGGVIKPSSGTTAKLKVATGSKRGAKLGRRGAVHDAVFNILKYR
jgi:RHS repeat-associated protein